MRSGKVGGAEIEGLLGSGIWIRMERIDVSVTCRFYSLGAVWLGKYYPRIRFYDLDTHARFVGSKGSEFLNTGQNRPKFM